MKVLHRLFLVPCLLLAHAITTQAQVYSAGTTWATVQHIGSSGRMVAEDDLGFVHTVWMNSVNAGGTNRHIYYNVWDPANGSFLFSPGGVQVDAAVRAGYVTQATSPEGFCFPSFHRQLTSNGPVNAGVAIDFLPGIGAFSSFSPAPLMEGGQPVQVAYPMIAQSANGNLHMLSMQLVGEPFSPVRLFYSRGTPIIEGGFGSEIDWQPVSGNQEFRLLDSTTTSAMDIACSPTGNRMAVAWARRHDFLHPDDIMNNDVYLMLSENGGTTWSAPQNITNFIQPGEDCYDLTGNEDCCNRDTMRAFQHLSAIFDDENHLHLAFSTIAYYRWNESGDGPTTRRDRARLWHWSETTQAFHEIAEYWYPPDFESLEPGLIANQAMIEQPSLSFDAVSNYLYCSYSLYDTSVTFQNAGYFSAEIYLSRSTDGGVHWSEGVNITNTAPNDESAQNEQDPSAALSVQNNFLNLFYLMDHNLALQEPTTPSDMLLRRVNVNNVVYGAIRPERPFHVATPPCGSPGFQAQLISLETQLMNSCEGGTPVPEGTLVKIFWDFNLNGPDPTDIQPPAGTENQNVNYNQFFMNSEGFGPGFFISPDFYSVGAMPDNPSYYLQVCVGNIHWNSETFTMVPGFQQVLFGTGFVEWNCVNEPCEAECPPPGTPTGVVATDGLCIGITIVWNGAPDVSGSEIWRDEVHIANVPANVLSYFDSPPAGTYAYRVRNFRVCDNGDTVYSAMSAPNNGTRLGVPSAPTGVNAMDDWECIPITWNADEWAEFYHVVRSNFDTLAVVTDPFYEDCLALPGQVYAYRVIARNACGLSTPSAQNSARLVPPDSGAVRLSLVDAGPPNWDLELIWLDGCVNRLVIYNFCEGTTGTITNNNGWIVTNTADSIVFETNDPMCQMEGSTTGFRLNRPAESCQDWVEWSSGISSGFLFGHANALQFQKYILTDNLHGASDVEAADMDGDGDMDVAAVGFIDDELVWWENQSEGNNVQHEEHVIATNQDGIIALDVGRVNPDTLADIVTVSRFSGELKWWQGHANGEFTPHLITGTLDEPFDVALANLVSPANMEVVAIARGSGQIRWWEYNGGSFTQHLVDENIPSATAIVAKRFSASTLANFVTISREPGRLSYWNREGFGFTRYDIDDEIYLGSGVDVGDLDDDGDMDIAAAIAGYDRVNWYENLGNETFERHLVVNGLDYVHDVEIADVDGDGLNDMITSAMWMDDISWWRNTGDGFLRNIVDDHFHQAMTTNAVDLNGDDFTDILAAGGSEIAIYFAIPPEAPPLTFAPNSNPDGEILNSRELESLIPNEYSLSVYPNPFNPVTTIEFGLPVAGELSVNIFDIQGRMVNTRSGFYTAGSHSFSFDAATLSTGVYFARIVSADFVLTKKMMVLK